MCATKTEGLTKIDKLTLAMNRLAAELALNRFAAAPVKNSAALEGQDQ